MKQLIANGHYWVPLSAHEYVATPVNDPDGAVAFVLRPPPNTTYTDAPILVVTRDGTIYSSEGKLAFTVDALNYGGALYDWNTGTTTQYRPPEAPESHQ